MSFITGGPCSLHFSCLDYTTLIPSIYLTQHSKHGIEPGLCDGFNDMDQGNIVFLRDFFSHAVKAIALGAIPVE